MPGAESGPAEASAGTYAGGLGHLPWQQIPKFVPGTTNVDEYVQRMRFLKELWPEDQLHLLGPRAALQVEGSAFQKISRISPEKLRQADGVKILVETLGGSWGRTLMEEKYHYFEQAIFQVSQRNDETNDSYVARHDAYFEELLARNVTIEQVRAYVLLRHSQLAPEDKKKVVIESQGDLRYAETVKAIRLLGSKFFGELQAKNSSSSKVAERSRVYDLHFTEEEGSEEAFYTSTQEEELDDEDLLCYFLEQNDADAIYIAEFEDSIVEAIQESELAPVYISYQEARQKLRDKAKARGFWGPSKGRGKGKSFGKKGKGAASSSNPAWGMGRNRSLADRIANSSCKLCGARGHWKRECPRRQGTDGRDDQRNEVTHYTVEAPQPDMPYLAEILHTVPQDSVLYMDSDEGDMEMTSGDEDITEGSRETVADSLGNLIQPSEALCLMACAPKLERGPSFKEVVARKVLMCARKNGRCNIATRKEPEQPVLSRVAAPSVLHSSKPPDAEPIMVATTGAEGVLDTGASRTVVGSRRVPEILEGLDAACRAGVRKAVSDVVFRFGNSGTLKSKHALLIPTSGSSWVRVEVIPGDTPLLISNRLLHELDAIIHVRNGYIQLPEKWVPLKKDSKGLSVVNLSALLCTSPVDCLQVTESVPENRQHATAEADTKSLQPSAAHQAATPAPEIPSTSRVCDAWAESQECSAAPGKVARVGRRCPTFGRGRQGPERGANPTRGVHRGRVPSPDGHRHSSGVGSHRTPGRETQRAAAQHCVRERPCLRGPDGPKELVNQPVGKVVQELQHRQTSSNGEGRAGEVGRSEGEAQRLGGEGDRGRHQGQREGDPPPEGDQAKDDSEESRRSGLGWMEAVPHGQLPSVGFDQKSQRRDDQRTDERGDVGGPAARADDSSGAPAPGACAVGADSREQQVRAESPEHGESHGQVLHLPSLCKQIDACAFQIEEKLDQLKQNTKAHDWMQHKLPRLDVLEITLTDGSVGNAVRRCRGRIVSLKTFNANKIWQLIYMYEPRHLWIDCGGTIPSKVFGSNSTLLDLYEHQVELGRHFHLCSDRNIFEASSLTGDSELRAILEETLCACHGPSQSMAEGRMGGNNFLNRKRYVYTTSRALHQKVDTRTAPTILSSPAHRNDDTTTQRSTTRPLRLADQAATAMVTDRSIPLLLSELLVVDHKREGDFNSNIADGLLDSAKQVVKRRRLWRKQPHPTLRDQAEGSVNSWGELFRRFGVRVVNRGRFYFSEGDEVVNATQRLIPHFQVKHVVMARGTNRVQLPKPGVEVQDIPLRQTIVVSRQDGKVRVDGEPEQWTRNPKYKRWRPAVPARISLTAYGALRQHVGPSQGEAPHRGSAPEGRPQVDLPHGRCPVVNQEDASPRVGDVGAVQPKCSSNVQAMKETANMPPAGLELGHPPLMVPRHGPGYMALNEEEKREVGRLHQNLGHPDAAVMAKFLEERKADPRIIQAAKDYACSVCLETVPGPKLARPASIHVDGDFGDVVGMDVAYWTGKSGQQHMFTHIIDEATLFHQATATGRTVEDQYEALTDSWTKWAGPCQFLYLDPAGEYIGDEWREKIQRDGICVRVAAGESHWQVGRVEAHGKILKSMLTRMDAEEVIASDADFRQCLRAATQAKNSLSRIRGFTPEQAVFGKSSRLPASLISDEQAASHALADSSLPEGLAFRQSLFRREQARAAFARVDNDGAYRRALLRKSRATIPSFPAGSWVLYWRQRKVGHRSRGERGRWYGPAQVITGDSRVVWVSHSGQLIKASPEHLRSASLREWHAVKQGQLASGSSSGLEGVGSARGVVDITQGELPTREEVDLEGELPVPHPETLTNPDGDTIMEHAGPSNRGVASAEQPEMEVSPVASLDPEPQVLPEPVVPESPMDPVNIPVPEDEDDDILFGDTECFLTFPSEDQVWEINVCETEVDPKDLPSPSEALQYAMLVSCGQKKRTEVRKSNCEISHLPIVNSFWRLKGKKWMHGSVTARLGK